MNTFKFWVGIECILVTLLLFLLPGYFKENKNTIKLDSIDFEVDIKYEPLEDIAELPDLKNYPKYWKDIIKEAALEYERELSEREIDVIYDEVEYWSKFYEIDKEIIFGIIETESQFYYLAKNWNKSNQTGDFGLMQINTVTISDFNNWTGRNVTEQDLLYDVRLNIEVGCWALNQKKCVLLRHDLYTIENLLYAYNAGQGRVIKNNVPQVTLDYGTSVLVACSRF